VVVTKRFSSDRTVDEDLRYPAALATIIALSPQAARSTTSSA